MKSKNYGFSLVKGEVIVQIKKVDVIRPEDFQKVFVFETLKLQATQGLIPESYITRIMRKQIKFETALAKAKSNLKDMVNGVHYRKLNNCYAIAITVYEI